MGFNTTVNILNDGMDQLKKHPEEFAQGVLDHYYDGGTFGVGNHGNVVHVAKSRHADEFSLFSVHGNALVELSPYSQETMRLVKRLPDEVRSRISAARYLLDRLEAELPDE